jgi:YegS/Rv2252/BmrU family lipid kinase
MIDGRNIQIIVNPVSGGSSSRRLVQELCGRLGAAGFRAELFETGGPGDGARRVSGLDADQCGAVVVIGGDGTVREVATALPSPLLPLVILPMGTENLVARYFRMRRDPAALVNLLRNGRRIEIDIAQMKMQGTDGVNVKRFLLVAGIGFDAEVVRSLAARRRGHICHADYFWPIWRSFWSYHHPLLRIETEHGVLFEGHSMAFVGNIPRYAVGLKLHPQADPQDGLLDVCVLPCRRQTAVLRHAVNVVFGRHVDSAGVLYRQAKTVAITARSPAPVELDGDLASESATTVELSLTGTRRSFLVDEGWRP